MTTDPDSLRELFQAVLQEYPTPEHIYNTARTDDPENYDISDWSNDQRRDLIVNQSASIFDDIPATEAYEFIASKGQQNAPNIPYFAFTDSRETETVQYGRDVVYLFDSYNEIVYLTLNQGAAKGPERLADRLNTNYDAETILDNLSEWYREKLTIGTDFRKESAALDEDLRNASVYNAGTIAYKQYSLDDLPDDETLRADLENALDAYSRLLEDTSKLPEIVPDGDVWQLSPEGGDIWPAWRDEGIATIGYTFDPADLNGDHDGDNGTTIDDWNLREDSGDGQAYKFQYEVDVGDTVVAATRRTSSQPHDVYGIGRVTATDADPDETPSDADIAGHTNIVRVDWTAFDDGLPFTLPVDDNPLGTRTLTQLDVDHGLRVLTEAAIGHALAGGLFDSEEAAITEVLSRFRATDDEVVKKIEASTPSAPYYWVNQSNNPAELEYGYLQAKNDNLGSHDLARLGAGDEVFHYQNGAIIGVSEVSKPPYRRFEYDDDDGEWVEKLRVDVDLTRFGPPLKFADIFQHLVHPDVRLDDYYPVNEGGINQRYFFNLSEEAGDYLLGNGQKTQEATERLERRLEIPETDVELPDDLYFHEGEEATLRRQINAALNSGKHIIFTGPPGTGKSRLAKAVGEQAPEEAVDDYIFTTATAEWTTFDTIGGYVPDASEGGEQLRFDPRLFLRCFRDDDDTIRNQWLIVDELNRANIDKALGQLFSVLSEDSVELPYERENRVRIDWVDDDVDASEVEEIAEDPDRFPVTPAWRLIGTMNTYDKTSLYELSYAFMRRFSFIHVGVPEIEDEDGGATRALLDPEEGPNYATAWAQDDEALRQTIEENHEQISVLWAIINRHRTIGPSIVLDIFQQMTAFEGGEQTAPLTSAVINLVFPQLEGMRQSKQEDLLDDLKAGGEIESSGPDQDSESVDLALDIEYLRRRAEDIYEFE
ncbi:MrcB family domain-containing protein [Halobacterium hubeiense]|uniref:MrcB family domain-containing protein n=1 Tax=Halobacterium hubeiense TaxID=1407499 RepID=UPI003C762B00